MLTSNAIYFFPRYIEQLIASAEAAVNEVVRRGVRFLLLLFNTNGFRFARPSLGLHVSPYLVHYPPFGLIICI
jgi:hypothetical protein